MFVILSEDEAMRKVRQRNRKLGQQKAMKTRHLNGTKRKLAKKHIWTEEEVVVREDSERQVKLLNNFYTDFQGFSGNVAILENDDTTGKSRGGFDECQKSAKKYRKRRLVHAMREGAWGEGEGKREEKGEGRVGRRGEEKRRGNRRPQVSRVSEVSSLERLHKLSYYDYDALTLSIKGLMPREVYRAVCWLSLSTLRGEFLYAVVRGKDAYMLDTDVACGMTEERARELWNWERSSVVARIASDSRGGRAAGLAETHRRYRSEWASDWDGMFGTFL